MLETIDHGTVRELRLARPPANAINPELMEKLITALNEASESAEAIVISGRPGMFTAGLDVPELIQYDRDRMLQAWHQFLKMLQTVACLPVPSAIAITGHAPAGGIVLALFGDSITLLINGMPWYTKQQRERDSYVYIDRSLTYIGLWLI